MLVLLGGFVLLVLNLKSPQPGIVRDEKHPMALRWGVGTFWKLAFLFFLIFLLHTAGFVFLGLDDLDSKVGGKEWSGGPRVPPRLPGIDLLCVWQLPVSLGINSWWHGGRRLELMWRWNDFCGTWQKQEPPCFSSLSFLFDFGEWCSLNEKVFFPFLWPLYQLLLST